MPQKPHKPKKQSTGSKKRLNDKHTGRQKQTKEKKRRSGRYT